MSSTIALDARVQRLPPLDEAESMLAAAWSSDRRLEETVAFEEITGDFDGRLGDHVDRHVEAGQPLCRILLSAEGDPRIAVVSHHSLLDGLGLVAALSTVIGHELGTTARGVDVEAVGSAGWGYALGRLRETILFPPTQIAPSHRGHEEGDHLAVLDLPPTRVGTAGLVGAAADAVDEWNGLRGKSARRLVVAVGATRGHGRTLSLAPRSAWLRLRIDDPSPEVVRRQLEKAAPEPMWSSAALATTPGVWLARRLARRTGSTLLVSNLGRLEPSGTVASAAFYPAAHGRSGVSIGCLTGPAATVLTIRARRSGFTHASARQLLGLIADHIRERLEVVALTPHLLTQHLDEVMTIENATQERLGSVYSEETWGTREFLRDFPGKWTFSALALSGGKVRGFWIASLRGDVVHTHRGCVEDAWRSRGVGRAMVEFVVEAARREDKRILTSSVPVENLPSIRLHEQLRFSRARGADVRGLLGPKAAEVRIDADYYETVGGQRSHLYVRFLDERRPA